MMLPHSWQGGASAWAWKTAFSFRSMVEMTAGLLVERFEELVCLVMLNPVGSSSTGSCFGKNFISSQRKM